jgi:hypothetical protein
MTLAKLRAYFVADINRWYHMGTLQLHVILAAVIVFVRENPTWLQTFVAQLPPSIQPHVPQIAFVVWGVAVPLVRLLDLGKSAVKQAQPGA